jgi:TatD DNase family protein
MELAERSGLPVIIHTRDADGDMMDILSERAPSHGGIMHCFSSGWPLAERALEAGMYISFAGPITYKSNHALREVLSKVPIDRLLLETDSPYLSPEPFRGKTNTPFRMREIYATAANIRKLSLKELARVIKENFARLFPQTGR